MENEEMTNDAAMAEIRLCSGGGMDGARYALLMRPDAVKQGDLLYSATTVAELRAQITAYREADESMQEELGRQVSLRMAAERRVAECESVLALVLGGMLSGAVECKPLMTKRDGDYVVGSLQELIEQTLTKESP